MSLIVLFTATRSADFQTLTVADASTAWGEGGNIGTGDVTAIELEIFGTDKETPLKTVIFTSGERSAFLAGDDVVFPFSDARMWGLQYSPDNFYVSQLNISGGSTISTQVAYDSYFYMRKIVINDYTSAAIPQSTFYEANRKIVGNLVSMFQLDTESSQITIARENMWRKVYNDLAWNYANII